MIPPIPLKQAHSLFVLYLQPAFRRRLIHKLLLMLHQARIMPEDNNKKKNPLIKVLDVQMVRVGSAFLLARQVLEYFRNEGDITQIYVFFC
jgi:hypothetical protein